MPDQPTIEDMADNSALDAYKDPVTGHIQFLNKTDDAGMLAKRQARGLVQATPEEVQLRSRYLKNTTLLGQAAAAGKLAARTAAFGVPFNDPESNQQIKDFSQASPTLSTLTKVAGAAAPAILTAGAFAPEAAGAAVAGELGTAARAAQIGSTVAEEVAGNTAFEAEQAKEESRNISVGNIIMGVGLGTGLTAVGRLARGVLPAGESVLEASESGSNAFAQGRRISGERRSVGAAGADESRVPATAKEVEAYAQAPEQFHEEVNRGAHDALADAFTGHEGVTGQTGGAARQVHGLAFKEQDVLPHMTDVDPTVATEAVYEHAEAAMKAAETLRGAGQGLAAKRIDAAATAAIQGLDGADAEMIGAKGAVGLNRLKQELDDVYGNYLRNKSVTSRSAAKEIEKAVEPLRANLEDAGTWGDFWAERQSGENKLWSGDNGIIQLSNIWQPEVFEAVKGKARVNVGDVLSEQMNRTPRADIAQHIMGLPPIKANKVLDAWDSTLDQWQRMTELKKESGLTRNLLEDGTSPVDLLEQSIAQQKQMIEELKFLRDAGPRAKPILAKLEAIGPARAHGEMAFDALEHIPGIGHAVKAADKIVGVSGRSLKDRLFAAEALPPTAEITREGALSSIAERQSQRGFKPPEIKGPGGGPDIPTGGGSGGGGGGGPSGAPTSVIKTQPKSQPASSAFTEGMAQLKARQGQEGAVNIETQVPVLQRKIAKMEKLKADGLEGARLTQEHERMVSEIEADRKTHGYEAGASDWYERDLKDRVGPAAHMPDEEISRRLAKLKEWDAKSKEAGKLERKAEKMGGEEINEELLADLKAKLAKYQTRQGTEGAAESGIGVKDILTSPMGITAGVGAVGVGGAVAYQHSKITDHLAEISDNAQAIQARAALGLTVKETRPPALPPLAERFKDGAPSLGAAFRNRMADLRQASEDPTAFVGGMTQTFGAAAHDHGHLFQQMVARTQIGVQYMLANAPPSVGISMVRPDGIEPDALAVMKFAAQYNAVFSPGDVVYDIGTGTAIPTQVKALREVHPDIYGSLRAEILKQVSQVGQNIPFETLRNLDNLFGLEGVAGPAFGPSMTTTMAQAYAAKPASSAQKSLGGESSIAPDQASKPLAGLSALA